VHAGRRRAGGDIVAPEIEPTPRPHTMIRERRPVLREPIARVGAQAGIAGETSR